jgi:hypothetical protein
MKPATLAQLTVLVSALTTSACGSVTPSGSGASIRTVALSGASVGTGFDRSPSWVAPDARNAPSLLYVSDLSGFTVRIYDFPSLKLVGKLTGFDEPQGLCSGAAGNIWVANTLGDQIIEFAHGGTKPIATLADPAGSPVGCAFDSKSGDLAVTNIEDTSGPASVLVYRRARGTPLVYGNPAQSADYFAGYDSAGNLYVSGSGSKQTYVLTVLPRGSNSLVPVKVTGATIYFPGTVAARARGLILGDQSCKKHATSCLYRAAVSGRTARVTGMVALGGSCDVAQAWVGAAQIAGGDDEANCKYGHSTVDRWHYPAGGAPIGSATGAAMPVGATVSQRAH